LNPPQVVFVRGNFWLEVWSNLNPVTFTPAGPKVAHPWPVNGTERLEDGAGHPLTEAEYYAYCRRRALARLAEPGVAVSHVVTQANAFWLGLAEAWRWHRSAAVFFLAQGVPALVGLVGLFLARKTLAPHARAAVLVMLIVFPLPYYLTGGGARYRHPIDPILYIGIACAVGYAVALARRGARAGAHR
jgi:hypothetical protein